MRLSSPVKSIHIFCGVMGTWLRQYARDLKAGAVILASPAFWRDMEQQLVRAVDEWAVEASEPRRKMRWAIRTARGRRR